MLGLNAQKLHITFHNPNTGDELHHALVVLAAEVAKTKVADLLVHMEGSPTEQAEQE